jgi:hypothetical protein
MPLRIRVPGPIYLAGAGGVAYDITITASSVPIVGATITPSAALAGTITASSVPIAGATIAPVFAKTEAITASSVPIGGATITPYQTVAYAVTITASGVPITGATIDPSHTAAGGITIEAGALPIAGATIAPVYAVTEPTITASSVPIAGATIAPVFAKTGVITASSVPITGADITPVFVGSIAYTVTIDPGALPITGATITPVFTPAIAPDTEGHSAGVTVAYRRRWYEYRQQTLKKRKWRPGEGTLEEILRGVYEAEDELAEPVFDLQKARESLAASQEAAERLDEGRQREAILQALMASQQALEQRTLQAAEQIAARRAEEFQAIQEAVMAAAFEWERMEQDDLEVLLLAA